MSQPQHSHRAVAVYVPEAGRETVHERATHLGIAERLARLLELEFVGEQDPRPDSRYYLVPTETLVGLERARQLGVGSAADLFGGVVPQPFVGTKSITHPLVSAEAAAPRGWCADFSESTRGAVLQGYTVFSKADARAAARVLLDQGPLRLKAVQATAGRGQWLAASGAEVEQALEELEAAEVERYGLVLEEQLEAPETYSVGQVQVGEQVVSYYGTQRQTRANDGAEVYGGSDLVLARGGFGALRALGLAPELDLAVRQAERYDAAADACFPGLLASRRNYDVARGRDAAGRERSGVLEQSWRIGGASSAEVAALEALRARPEVSAVRASSYEVYGRRPPPPRAATVLFDGEDPVAGHIAKYATVEDYDGT